MQTFLPYSDFQQSAKVLDYRRLGKQRVEAYQILLILTGKTERKGWSNHPAVKMWRGFEPALGHYMNIMIAEWIRRGYKNTMNQVVVFKNEYRDPHWLGDKTFHSSHRSNLLRKDPVFYGKYGWTEQDDIPYVWPVNEQDKRKGTHVFSV